MSEEDRRGSEAFYSQVCRDVTELQGAASASEASPEAASAA